MEYVESNRLVQSLFHSLVVQRFQNQDNLLVMDQTI